MNVSSHYTRALGAVPQIASRSAERRDPMLARTGQAARSLMATVRGLPPGKQVDVLDRTLAKLDPNLPAKTRRVASHLKRKGMSVEQSVERALALSLADASIEKIKQMGYAARQGRAPARVLSGLGTTGSETQTEQKAEDVVVGLIQGIVCSNDLQAQTANMVGRSEGADAASATNIGFEVGQGVAMCPPGTTPTPSPTTTPTTTTEEKSYVVPIAVGVGALALVGGIVWWTQRKK